MYFLTLNMGLENNLAPQAKALEPHICKSLVLNFETIQEVPLLSFQVKPSWLALDILSIENVNGAQLCSQRLLDIFIQASVQHSIYPAQLLNATTGEILPARYFFWYPERVKAIDWERSEYEIDTLSRGKRLTKLVLTPSCEEMARPLFRLEERTNILIHHQLRQQLEKASIKGMVFAPLDAIYNPYEGIRKEELEHILQHSPNDLATRRAYVSQLVLLHRYQEGLDAVNQLLTLQADDAVGWHIKGNVLSHLGKKAEAAQAMLQSLQLEPHSRAWGNYCQLLLELGQKKDALDAALQYVRLQEKHYKSWQTLGNVYASLEHYEEAVAAFEKARESGSTFSRGMEDILAKEAECLYKLGSYEEALALYNHHLLERSQDPSIWEAKMRVLRALRRDEEINHAQQVLADLQNAQETREKWKPL